MDVAERCIPKFSDSVEKSLNKCLPNCNIEIRPSDEFKRRLQDASEKEIVRASLEATMEKTAAVCRGRARAGPDVSGGAECVQLTFHIQGVS